MPNVEHQSHNFPGPSLDFSGLSPIQIVQLKMRNNIELTPEEFQLWEKKLEEERIDDQQERRGRY